MLQAMAYGGAVGDALFDGVCCALYLLLKIMKLFKFPDN